MPLFPDADSALLKNWVTKRLEHTSDADVDVLADYVLALLRHDGDETSVRELCLAEIPDFLQEDSAGFVAELFNVIKTRAYSSNVHHIPTKPTLIPTGPALSPLLNNGHSSFHGNPTGPQNPSRKRTYNDAGHNDVPIRGYGPTGGETNVRTYKQARRGGMAQWQNSQSQSQSNGSARSPSLPGTSEGISDIPFFDANVPMTAVQQMLAMQQALGLPVPPQLAGLQKPPTSTPRLRKSCRDYDANGFCTRGNDCKFEHGAESVPVLKYEDEYDPTNALMVNMSTAPTPSQTRTNIRNGRGAERDRGHGGAAGNGRSRMNGRREVSGLADTRSSLNHNNTSIVVEQIPEEKFSEAAVTEFFSIFGSIEEIDLREHKHVAIIKYGDWASAKAAYSSPKAIFDNRFVKVYWYKGENCLPSQKNGKTTTAASGVSTNMPADGDMSGIIATPNPDTVLDMEEFSRKQAEAQQRFQEKLRKKIETERRQKELEDRQAELRRKQADELARLTQKLSGNMKSVTLAGDANRKRSNDDKKESLRAQLAALEAEATSLGLDPVAAVVAADNPTQSGGYAARERGRGRGGYLGRTPRGGYMGHTPRGGRGTYRGGFARGHHDSGTQNKYSLDNRPKTIKLTGIDFTIPSNEEALRTLLLSLAEPKAINLGTEYSSIGFAQRFEAEMLWNAIKSQAGGRISGVTGNIELDWIANPAVAIPFEGSAAPVKEVDADVMDISGGAGYEDDGEGSVQDGRSHDDGEEANDRHNLDYDVGEGEVW